MHFCKIYLKTVNCIITLHLHKIGQRSRYKPFLGLYLVFLISVLCVSTCVCAYDSWCAQQADTPESSGAGDIVCHLTWVLARSPASLCKTIFPTTLKNTSLLGKKKHNLIQPCNQRIILDSRTVGFRS